MWAFAGAKVDLTLTDMPGAVPLLNVNISDVKEQVGGWDRSVNPFPNGAGMLGQLTAEGGR